MKELDNFFGFGEVKRMLNDLSIRPLLSNCCSAKPFSELFRNFGRCSDCMEMAEFSKDEEGKS